MSFLLQNTFKQLSISARHHLKGSTANTAINSLFYKQLSNKPSPSEKTVDYEVIDPLKDKLLNQELIDKVKSQIKKKEHDRLFAVVHLAGKQFKVTEGDLIVIENYWPPVPGDRIKLDKVLLVGAKDFTLIGRPLVQDGLVDVKATVIEKTLSHTKTNFKKKRRKQYKQIDFYRVEQTMLRINEIDLKDNLDNPPEVTGLEHRIM